MIEFMRPQTKRRVETDAALLHVFLFCALVLSPLMLQGGTRV